MLRDLDWVRTMGAWPDQLRGWDREVIGYVEPLYGS